MTTPSQGHTPAEGYAASLRQQAEWADVELAEAAIDTDELRAAAEFIERQAKLLAEAERALNKCLHLFWKIGGDYRDPVDWCKAGAATAQILIQKIKELRG